MFWIGSDTLREAAMRRHLRTLNQALIPKEYDNGGEPPAAPGETHEPMLFRHADGNVMAEVLPVLNEA